MPDTTLPCHCANLRRAMRAVTNAYDAALAPVGIKSTQYTLLRVTSGLEPVTMTALAERLGLDRTTLARNVQPLVTQGLLHAKHGQDRRTHEMSLTPQGRAVLEAANPRWEQAQTRIEDHLGPEKIALLRELLRDLHNLP